MFIAKSKFFRASILGSALLPLTAFAEPREAVLERLAEELVDSEPYLEELISAVPVPRCSVSGDSCSDTNNCYKTHTVNGIFYVRTCDPSRGGGDNPGTLSCKCEWH